MKLRYGAVLVIAAAAAIALAGCSSSPSTTSSAGADATTLIQQSSDAMKNLTSTHFVITADGKIPNLKVTKLEADVAAKPAVAATGIGPTLSSAIADAKSRLPGSSIDSWACN